MDQLVSEAFIPVNHASSLAEKICEQLRELCRSVNLEDPDWLLAFVDGRAIIRPTGHGLFFRVSAKNLVTFHGIRALIEGSLWRFASDIVSSVDWLPATGVPFHGLRKRLGDGRQSMKNP